MDITIAGLIRELIDGWPSRPPSRLALLVVATFVLATLEIIYAVVFVDSLSLLANAFHVLFTSISLAISTVGLILAQHQPTFSYSYGRSRFEVLAAFSNAMLLIFIALFVMAQGLQRIVEPHAFVAPADHAKSHSVPHNDVSGGRFILHFGVAGLVLNAVGLLIAGPSTSVATHVERFRSSTTGDSTPRDRDNKHAKASQGSHVQSTVAAIFSADSLSSAAIIVSCLLQRMYGWATIDVLASMLVSTYTLYLAFPLFSSTGLVLLQAAPWTPQQRAALRRIRREVTSLDGVLEVTSAHYWVQGPGQNVGSVSVRISDSASESTVIAAVTRAHNRHAGLAFQSLVVQAEKDPALYGYAAGSAVVGEEATTRDALALTVASGGNPHSHGHSHDDAHGHSHGNHDDDGHGHSHGHGHGHSHGGSGTCSHGHSH